MRGRNWLDPYCLANRLISILGTIPGDDRRPGRLPDKIEFTGFDRILPWQQSLFEALEKAGVEVMFSPPGASNNQKVEFHDSENQAIQWLNAAHWARGKLLDNPQARLAIIAPNLNKAAPAIEYALQQILCPQQLVEPGVSADLPYHLSLGKKLSRYPVAAAALAALAPIAGKALPGDAISRLILSPFIRGADTEAVARARLERWCRRRLPYQIRFRQFLKELPEPDQPDSHPHGPHCPLLIQSLQAAAGLLKDLNQAKPASHWAHRFSEWLDLLGWPGERGVDSDEFQAVRAFREQLRRLALLDLTLPPVDAASALSWLQRRVDEQPFQVEAGGAPVQVLGVFEAAGQRFDGIWFGGLVEADWPPPRRPNPFIAMSVQREAGVSETSIEAHRKQAETLQQRLIASAGEIVLSRPCTEDDIPAEPSALVDWPAATPGDAPRPGLAPGFDPGFEPGFDTPANIMHAHKPELEAFIDTRGPAFGQDAGAKGGVAKGGITLIENQAKCPFRAFAVHRLGARQSEQNQQGLAAPERGSLLHHALQLAWHEIQSSEKLHSLSDDQLREIILNAAEQAGRRHQVSSGCGERFHQTQTQWAGDTVSEWFEVEKRRLDRFTVHALEKEFKLNLNGLELTFKADRIDQMPNGSLALIDYKTGATDSPKNWSGARPPSPQLPLYAVAQEGAVETVVFGRVKSGDCRFIGVSRDSEFDPTVGPLASSRSLKHDFDHWDALLDHWRTVLAQLAAEFLGGEARVDPLNPNVCAQCDLHGLCRIEADSGAQREPAQ